MLNTKRLLRVSDIREDPFSFFIVSNNELATNCKVCLFFQLDFALGMVAIDHVNVKEAECIVNNNSVVTSYP